jgi:hypothetical protein
MRINLRLMGLLHGILLIGLIGRLLMYGGGRRRVGGGSGGRGRAAALAMGLAVFAIGSIGVLCGRMIQSAISRQREFLADAAAVQFTRNPEGLAGALKKIGGLEEGVSGGDGAGDANSGTGSRVSIAEAQEASHLFFSYPLSGRFLSSLFSTHPPLEERVRRLDPDFDEELPPTEEPTEPLGERAAASLHGGGNAGAAPAEQRAEVDADAGRVAVSAGTLDADHVRHGHDVLEGLPPALRRAAHEPLGAVALVYGLLLDPDPATREDQLATLRPRLEHGAFAETRRLFPHLEGLERRARLPLVDVAAPALRELSGQQAAHFLGNVQRLVEADSQLTLFEYALRVIVRRRLHHALRSAVPERARYRRLRQVRGAVEALLSAMAHVGHRSDEDARAAFRAGLACFEGVGETGDADPHPVAPPTLDRALHQLQRARPPLQRQIVDACAHCVLHDRAVTTGEAELLRAVAVALGCPLPPFLPAADSEDGRGRGT